MRWTDWAIHPEPVLQILVRPSLGSAYFGDARAHVGDDRLGFLHASMVVGVDAGKPKKERQPSVGLTRQCPRTRPGRRLPVQPPSAEPGTVGGGVASSATSEKARVVPSQVK